VILVRRRSLFNSSPCIHCIAPSSSFCIVNVRIRV
jgi:hypothetical protein